MTAICYNLQGFSAFISSTVAMTCAQNSEVAQDVIVNAIIVIADTETKLNEIHTALDTINTDITSLKDGDKVVDEIEETKTKITDCLNSIHGVTDKADILAENVDTLLNNKEALKTLLQSNHAFDTLANSSANEKVAQAIISLNIGTYINGHKIVDSGLIGKRRTVISHAHTNSTSGYNVTFKSPNYIKYDVKNVDKTVNRMFSNLDVTCSTSYAYISGCYL